MKFIITLALFVVVAVSALPHRQIRPLMPRLRADSSRIVGGSPAQLGQFPYQVTIIYETPQGGLFCSGSLISADWVLTAARCAFGAFSFTIDLGSIDLATPNVRVTSTRPAFVHPDYVENQKPYDIALIQLDTSVQFDTNILPVTLNSVQIGPGQDATISGWGYTSDTSTGLSQFLNWAVLNTMNNDGCNRLYGGIDNGMICAISMDTIKAICNYDWGGPLVLGEGSSALLIGVASFGSDLGCETSYPSVFTRTSYYRNWIQEVSGV